MTEKWEIVPEDNGEKSKTRKQHHVKGKRGVIIFTVSIFLVLLLAPIIYYYIIPREEMTITTIYHEISGAGGTGLIAVAFRVENTGTQDITDLSLKVLIVNQTYETKDTWNHTVGKLELREKIDHSEAFSGTHYKNYYITIETSFTIEGNHYHRTITHSVIEKEHPEMNIEWKDTIS